jgi:predicted RNase H-like HicB family nuclease
MKLSYPACFYKDEETGYYLTKFPDLPGVCSGGNSIAEAMLMGAEAGCSWLLAWLETGGKLPAPSPLETIKPDEGGFVNLLALDLDEHSKKYGSQPIDQTLKIPAYLNTFAETQRLDLSKIVQDTLSDLYLQTISD